MSTSEYKYQVDKNKQGEITYRKMVAEHEQQDLSGIINVMKERIVDTVQVFEKLDKKYNIGITKDMVFGEFGAERAQRVMALMDHYQLQKSYAFDISPDMLNLSKAVSESCFAKSNNGLPHERLVLVADDFLKAKENIQPQQLDVVFCFATIHHFPDPRPVFKTVYSLLKDGGYFYFDREALKSWLGLHEVGRFRTYLEHGHIIERDHGILETQFSLRTWKEAIETFEHWDVRVKYPLPGLEKVYNFNLKHVFKNPALKTMLQFSGARIFGLLRKNKPLNKM